jgi:hypothetical protein
MVKTVANRPQVSFLPAVKDTGTFPAADLESYRETLKIIKDKETENVTKAELAVPIVTSATAA